MFKKNLEFINNEALKQRLEKISLEEATKGISYCVTPSNDYILLKNDVPIDDLNNPREAVKQMLKTTIKNSMGSNDLIINFGIGLGYLLDETYNTYPSKIYVYEPDIKLLYFVLNNIDISEHLSGGRIYITDRIDELEKKISETYITKDKIEIVYLKNYAILKNNELLELTQKVYETCKSKMIDVNTITKYSRTWLSNTLKNISYVNSRDVYKLSDLEDKFIGQTALIIAPGPSLKDNIEKIKANRNKFVIFAVNKALRALYQAGITPDFAIFLDAEHINATLTGLADFCKNINCIMDLKSDSIIFNYDFKRIFLSFSQNDFVLKSLSAFNSDIKIYEYGGSATTFALVSAIKMGFSKVIFSGLDLAFNDNTMYATGEEIRKVDEDKILIGDVAKKIVKVKSITGEDIYTREDYATFIKHFEALIKELNYTEIYNTTTFGAYIEGVKNVQFENIPLLFPCGAISFILNSVPPFRFNIKDWGDEELHLINNVINLLSKGNFSPALVSSIVKSPLMYQYMQADILQVLQSKFDISLAEEFISKSKTGIKEVVDLLQKNRLI